MKNLVIEAFKDFDKGIRPEGYKPAQSCYVVGGNGKLYPAKAIWAIAFKTNPTKFHTKDAVKGLAELKYSIINIKALEEMADFDAKIQQSARDSTETRRNRLGNAAKTPESYTCIITKYIRNPDVVAEVLHRANGICEECRANAPFNKKIDGTPYLEVHHKTQLSKGGDDTVENAIALCPNCHRKTHHG